MTNRKTLYVTGAIAAIALVGGAALMESKVLGVLTEDPWGFPDDPLEARHPSGMNDGEPLEGLTMNTVQGILRAYDVPHYMEYEYESYMPSPGTPVEFGETVHVRRNQRLETTLQQIEASAPFPLAWDVINGVVRVYPAEVPEGERCLPSVPVTVQGSMTPWEAIKTTFKQMNEAYWPLGERPLEQSEGVLVLMAGVGTGDLSDARGLMREGVGVRPPDRFARELIELDLQDAPAREALARIQAASGYAFDMTYRHFSDQRDVFILFLNWGDTREEERARRDAHRATLEEAVLWTTSMQEIRRGQYGVDWEWNEDDYERWVNSARRHRFPDSVEPAGLSWPIDPDDVP